MKIIKAALVGLAMAVIAPLAAAQQFVPILSYRVGPYAAGGSGYFGGVIDYFNLVNLNGGINGVKLLWEECETEYNAARGVECYERLKAKNGGASMVEPLSTGIAYGLIDRVAQDGIPMTTFGYGLGNSADGRVFKWVFPLGTTYWSQAAAMVAYLETKVGGAAKLKGKKIAYMYHDSAFGKEAIPVMDALAAKDGFELIKIPITPPGQTQESQWLQVRRDKPDFVILWGFGVMNPVALKTAAKTGFPRDKIVGVWWAGSEEDVIPAGDSAKGYISAAFSAPGTSFPVMQDIANKLYKVNKGNLEDPARQGSIYHTRGVVYGILAVEAIRKAQDKFGKGKVMTPDQVRWGLEHLDLTDARIKQLGAEGMFPAVKTSCFDHEGSGMVKFQVWDGKEFKPVTGFIAGDTKLVRKMVEESAAKYAADKKITPRDCSREN